MIKKFEQAYIRRMAKLYRDLHPDMTIRKAVYQASTAYELYKETELEMMYEDYERTGQRNF